MSALALRTRTPDASVARVPEVAAPAGERAHLPQLDGLRACAALLVVTHHAWIWRYLTFGYNGAGIYDVWLFFVLTLLCQKLGTPELARVTAGW